jgi:hypothetical protein
LIVNLPTGTDLPTGVGSSQVFGGSKGLVLDVLLPLSLSSLGVEFGLFCIG